MKVKRKMTLGVLYLMAALSLTSCKEKEQEAKKLEKNIVKEIENITNIELTEKEQEKTFKLEYCDIIVENHSDGSVKHHFITNYDYDMHDFDTKENEKYKESKYEYKAITDENLIFSDFRISYNGSDLEYRKIPEIIDGRYILDHNVPYFIINTGDIKLPEGYSLEDEYSSAELKELEEKLDVSIYNNRKENKEYYISTLLLVKVADEYMCFDIIPAAYISECITTSEDVEDVTKLQEFFYLPSIGNKLINLKLRKVVEKTENDNIIFSIWEEGFAYEDITSLDQSVRNDLRGNQLIFKDFSDYLIYEQKSYNTITEEEIIEVLNKLNSPEHKLEEKCEELTEQNESVEVSYYDNSLSIYKKENAEGTSLTEEFYEKLNAILEEGNINRISFYNIDNTLDLNKIDTSKATRKILHFENYEGTLDCFSLTGDMEFYFTNTNGDIAAEVLSTCQNKLMSVYWKEWVKNKSTLENFLEGIKEKEMESLNIKIRNNGNYKGITQKEFNLLSKVSAERVELDADGFKKPINLNLELNPKIRDLSIEAYDFCNKELPFSYELQEPYKNGELGNIKIKSENPELYCRFYHTDITQNTHFSLPNSTTLWLHDLNCADIRAFKDLKNVSHLEFKEDYHTNGAADTRGEVVYDAKEMPSDIMGEIPYNDYNRFLKELKYFFMLKQLRERMNLESGYSTYNKINIGAYSNLISDDVNVYKSLEDLKNKQNPVSSYFGTEELRCISSICLANDETEVNVNNMETYEYYLNEGYEVIGATYINRYATTPEEREFFVPVESIKLRLLPFE